MVSVVVVVAAAVVAKTDRERRRAGRGRHPDWRIAADVVVVAAAGSLKRCHLWRMTCHHLHRYQIEMEKKKMVIGSMSSFSYCRCC